MQFLVVARIGPEISSFAVRAISESWRKETLGKVRVAISQLSGSFSYISPSAISRAVRYAIKQPDEVVINEIVVRPSNQNL